MVGVGSVGVALKTLQSGSSVLQVLHDFGVQEHGHSQGFGYLEPCAGHSVSAVLTPSMTLLLAGHGVGQAGLIKGGG